MGFYVSPYNVNFDLKLFNPDDASVKQLFRFIPTLTESNSYRITSQYFGPTRSLTYDIRSGYLGFNQTNNTATSQHWFVYWADGGNNLIVPYGADRLYLTADSTGKISVEFSESFCAWCLIEDGDFMGSHKPQP